MMLRGNLMIDDKTAEERKLAYEALDKFNGVQIMNAILNEKFGFRIPDVGSMTVQKMLKRFKKRGQQLKEEAVAAELKAKEPSVNDKIKED